MADQHPPHVHVVEEPRSSLFSNIVAIIGFIILIVVVIWGLVHLAGLSRNWFAGLFGNAAPQITITAPKDVDSGKEMNVSWKYTTIDRGNYAVVYRCTSGLTVTLDGSPIPCGASFTVGSKTSLALVPTLSGAAAAPMQMTVLFLPSATSSKQAQGVATINVRAAQTTNTPAQTTPVTQTPLDTTPTVTTKPTTQVVDVVDTTPRVTTPSDLAVRIIAIGVIDPVSGMFVNRAPMYQGDIAAAQFDISNVGGSTSLNYFFSASLPTRTAYNYVSSAQAPLAPGSHVVNTLRWSDSNPSGGAFSVTITTNDSNPGNNSASQWLAGGSYAPAYYQTY